MFHVDQFGLIHYEKKNHATLQITDDTKAFQDSFYGDS